MTSFSIRRVLIVCLIVSAALTRIAVAQHVPDTVDAYGTILDRQSHRPIAGASINALGPVRRTSQSDVNGTFAFLGLPPGTYVFKFSASGYDTLTERSIGVLAGQDSQIGVELALTSQVREIGRVSVSASSFNITPASVTSLSSQQITQYGFDGYRRNLEDIPGVTILKESQGSDQRGEGNEYAGTPYGQSFVSLRGALPYQTSVLFDGHRLNSANREGFQYGNNVAGIDPYSFARIDVIAGPGATSPTVNNATGGTLNFVSGRAGIRDQTTFDLGNDGIGSTTLHLGYENQTPNGRLGGRADLTNITTDFPSNYPVDRGYIIWGEAAYSNPVARVPGGPYSEFGSNGFPNLGGIVRPYIDPNWGDPTASAACCYNFNTPAGGFRRSASANLRYDLSPLTTISMLYTTTTQWAQDAFSLMQVPFSPSAIPGARYAIPNGTLLYAANSADGNPAGAYTDSADQIAEFNLQSSVGKASVRASYLTQSDKQHTYYPFAYPAGAYQFYGDGTSSDGTPVALNGQTFYLGDAFNNSRDDSGLNQTRDALLEAVLPVGTSQLSASLSDNYSTGTLQHNINGNQILPSDPASTNLVQAPPNGVFQNFITERFEYNANILRNVRAFTSLYVNQYHFRGATQDAAGNQTGTFDTDQAYTTPRVAFEYRPVAVVAYRLSAGGAVSPLDVSLYNNVGGPPQPNSATTPTFYTVSVSPSGLKPETSFGEDAGFDLRLPQTTTLSLDLYNTSVSGQFYTSYQQLGTYLDLPLYTAEAANLGRSRFYGLALSASHLPLRGLTWGLAGSLQRAYAYDIPGSVYYNPNDPTSPNNLGIVPNINFDGYDNLTAIPYAQGRATFGFRAPRLSATLGLTYYGNNNSYYRPAFAALDVSGSFRLARNTTLNVAVANVTNAYGQLLDNPDEYRLLPVIAGSSTSPYQYGSNMVYPQVFGPPAISINLRQAVGN